MPSFRSRVAGFISGVTRGNPLDNPAVPLSGGAPWLYELLSGGPSESGAAVNDVTAMRLATFNSCVNILSADVSSLPIGVYEVTKKGTIPATDSDLHYLLSTEPNPEMSAPVFYGALMACVAAKGDAYAEIQRDRNGKPIAMWPWQPEYVKAKRDDGKQLYFEITAGGETRRVEAKDMIHVPGLTFDGVTSDKPIRALKRTLGIAIAAEKFAAGFFGRGSRPSGILTGPAAGNNDDKSREQAKKSWENANSGEGQGRTAVMPNGWEWKPISVSPETAQSLQTQEYSRAQICARFRIPPHMVGDNSRLSNGNHESQSLEYVKFTLRPWLVRFEAELQRKLMPRLGPKAFLYTVRFDVTELERADFGAMMTAFAIGKQWGFFNTNDIRQMLRKSLVDGPAGTEYMYPLNMVPASKMMDEPAAPTGGNDGNDEGSSDALPKGNGGQNQRLLDRMGQVFAPLFRDAAGRLLVRSTRDSVAVQQLLGPVLQSIAIEAKRQACQVFLLKPETDLGEEKILRDTARAIEKRAAAWTATTVDAERELAYAVRSIMHGIFREAGSALALAA